MGYALGIDLGTTAISAARFQDGLLEPIELSPHAFTAPAVTKIVGPDDRAWISGPGALAEDPTSAAVVRHVKRELGRDAPMLIDRVPIMPEQVLAHQLRWVYDTAIHVLGEHPDRVTLTHPANWRQVQFDCFKRAAACLDTSKVGHLEEPDAAAQHFAAEHTIPTGNAIVVFDFGGGTTDVSVLRKAAHRFEVAGRPVGNPTLGGIDLTDALVDHLRRTRPELAALDPRATEGRRMLVGFVDAVRAAKESLSTNHVADVAFPAGHLDGAIRVSRAEFDDLATRLVDDAVDLIPEALDVAEIHPDAIHGVLLVGGASSTPLVGARIQEVLGHTPLLSGDPKLCVSLGAALVAAAGAGLTGGTPAIPVDRSGQGIVVDLVDQGLSASRDIPHEVATVSEFRTTGPRKAFVMPPTDDLETDRSGVRELPPDRRLAIVAAVVLVVLIVGYAAARLLTGDPG